jgi:hypothetical protein
VNENYITKMQENIRSVLAFFSYLSSFHLKMIIKGLLLLEEEPLCTVRKSTQTFWKDVGTIPMAILMVILGPVWWL